MGLSPSVERQDKIISISLSSPELLIGNGGQNIVLLEILIKRMVYKQTGELPDFTLDINNYRQQKRRWLKRLAQDSAYRAVLTKQAIKLKPMSAYERRLVHTELTHRSDITTNSQGEGRERCIIISPA